MSVRFYLNKVSKTVIITNNNIDSPEFVELIANTNEASKEKHIPDVKINSDVITVSVGSIMHPMDEDHYI